MSPPACPACRDCAVAADDAQGLVHVGFETGNPVSGALRTGNVFLQPGPPLSDAVCVQSVPGFMTAADFCLFVAQHFDTMRHMRMVRPKAEKNNYMVLAKFASAADAARFADTFQGRDFLVGLQLEEKCSVIGVHSAVMDAPEEKSQNALERNGELSFPGSLVFPDGSVECVNVCNRADDGAAYDPGRKGTESKCPVCQDSLESGSDGEGKTATLVTTVCNHTMHAECLSKWTNNKCPVCRHSHELVPEASSCMSCGETRGLWMCIICAFVGCGFYENKHAEQHSKDTQHPFVINIQDYKFSTGDEIAAGSVWDYTSKRFVQRLISSEDGKVVEVARGDGVGSHSGGAGGSGNAGGSEGAGAGASGSQTDGCSFPCKKSSHALGPVEEGDEEDDRGFRAAIYASNMDARVGEYRAQLESLDAEYRTAQARYEESRTVLEGRLSEREAELAKADTTVAQLRDELKACKKQLGRKAGEAEKEGKALKEKNVFLKSLNESLLRDKRGWTEEVDRLGKKLAEKEMECAEKDEQLRDMMLHLEAQAKVAEASASGCRAKAGGGSSAEASGGDILGVGPSAKERLARKTRRK